MNIESFKKFSVTEQPDEQVKPRIPSGMWTNCPYCHSVTLSSDLGEHKLCPHCSHHFMMGAEERLAMILDEGSFRLMDDSLVGNDPLAFPGYAEKLQALQQKTGLSEGVVCGQGSIQGTRTVICVMDGAFMMGSMGVGVGERITRAVEFAAEKKLPLVIFTVSGGARMQEGIMSLMQMAKISGALNKLAGAGMVYVAVLTDPTMGGVTASFAMLGDIILAEPGARIGFAGRRVIEQTIHQQLPDEFQTAEFLLAHGFIDQIVPRVNLRGTLSTILKMHT